MHLYEVNFQISQTFCAYEITFDRLVTAFGKEDKMFSFDTLRVKKFNRTT